MKKDLTSLKADERIETLAGVVENNDGKLPTSDTPTKEGYTQDEVQEAFLSDLKVEMAKLDALRKGNSTSAPVEISLGEYVKERYLLAPNANGTPESFYKAIGIDPSTTSVDQLMSMGEINEAHRSIIPEVFREAVRLGLRKEPIYRSLIKTEESVNQMQVTMPNIKMSDATPKKVGELETISTGQMTFGSKVANISKLGIGIKLSDESVRFSSINMLAIFLEDIGVKLGLGLDVMAIETLFNGDQKDGSDSAAIIGVGTAGTLAYKDMLRAWLRMQRIGNTPTAMLLNEGSALDVLQMEEFKHPSPQYALGTNPSGIAAPALNFRTALPQNQDVFVHAGMPDEDYLMLVNKEAALVKLNAQALRVERDRNAANQFDAYYVSLMTGYATLKRDARLVIDKSIAFSGNAFPSWMDVNIDELVKIS